MGGGSFGDIYLGVGANGEKVRCLPVFMRGRERLSSVPAARSFVRSGSFPSRVVRRSAFEVSAPMLMVVSIAYVHTCTLLTLPLPIALPTGGCEIRKARRSLPAAPS